MGITTEELLKMGAKPTPPQGGVTTEQLLQMGGKPSGGSAAPGNEPQVGFFKDAYRDVADEASQLGENLGKRADNIAAEWRQSGAQNPLRTAVNVTGQAAGAVGDVIGGGIMGIGRMLMPQKFEDKLTEGVTKVAESAPVQAAAEAWRGFEESDPDNAKLVANVFNLASVLPAYRGAKAAKDTGEAAVEAAARKAARIAPKPAKPALRSAGEDMLEAIRPTQGEISKFEIKRGRDLKEIAENIAREKIMPDIEDGKMNWKAGVEKLGEVIKTEAPRLRALLEKSPETVNLADVAVDVQKSVAKMFKNAQEYDDAMRTINELIEPELKRYGMLDVPLSLANDIKSGMWSVGYDAMRPLRSRVARQVGHAISDAIEKRAPKLVQRLNKRMSLAYDGIEVLTKATGRVLPNGRLGNQLAGTVGGIVGGTMMSGVPFIGPAVVAVIGSSAGHNLSKALTEFKVRGQAKRAVHQAQKQSKKGLLQVRQAARSNQPQKAAIAALNTTSPRNVMAMAENTGVKPPTRFDTTNGAKRQGLLSKQGKRKP